MKRWHVYEMDRGRLVGSFYLAEVARSFAHATADRIDDTVKLAYGTFAAPTAIDDAQELRDLGFVIETFHPAHWK